MTSAPSELEQHAREEFLPSPALLQARVRLERDLDQVRDQIEREINEDLLKKKIITVQELADRDFGHRFPAGVKELKPQEVHEEMFV